VPYEFAGSLVDLLALEFILLVAGQVINCTRTDEGDVISFAVKYFSVHRAHPATPKISHLYKSGDTYDNFLRLVRPTDPC